MTSLFYFLEFLSQKELIIISFAASFLFKDQVFFQGSHKYRRFISEGTYYTFESQIKVWVLKNETLNIKFGSVFSQVLASKPLRSWPKKILC